MNVALTSVHREKRARKINELKKMRQHGENSMRHTYTAEPGVEGHKREKEKKLFNTTANERCACALAEKQIQIMMKSDIARKPNTERFEMNGNFRQQEC